MPVIALFIGFLAGVIVNLFADYFPWRRHYQLTMTSPFASRDIVALKPGLMPRYADGKLVPVPLWSGVIATLTGKVHGKPQYQFRRVVTEIGLAIAFALIAWRFAENRTLPFLLFYAALFLLIAIIDIEHRWVFVEIIISGMLVALAETIFLPGVDQGNAIKGGLYGFGILFALYLLGIVFARVMGVLSGRPIGRTVLGFGDAYIGALGGLIIGASSLGFALFIMVVTGALGALWVIVKRWRKSGRYRRYAAIPYGPYILIGMATMLYTPELVSHAIRSLLHWNG